MATDVGIFREAIGYETRLHHPFSMVIAGPSNCGKTFFVKDIIQYADTIITAKVDNIVYIYSCWQPMYDQLLKIRPINFVVGIPDSLCDDALLPPNVNNLLIVDDVMAAASQHPEIQNVFTKYVHHRNLSCIYLVQNLFVQGKASRTISLNANYLTLFKTVRDKNQIMSLAKQMYPGASSYFMQAYNDATARAFGYLLIDFRQTTPDCFRLRTSILSDTPVVYLPRKPIV